jgi:anionic cell wall polymer biosynthesis LytR-Cps2A-Psr (LCP) family protein
MTTVIAVLDRAARRWNSRTDVLVLVDGAARRLTWIPRDLYAATIGHRINEAYRLGGASLLVACLREHGLSAENVACISRAGAARWLEALGPVTVPVARRLEYRYPLSPEASIRTGAKTIVFHPPEETLEGERVHQWLGARYGPPVYTAIGGDLDRCRRQQLFLAALLATARPLPSLRPHEYRGRFGPEVGAIGPDWTLSTLDDVRLERLDGKSVLRRPSEGAAPWPRWRLSVLRLRKLCSL